MEPRLLPKRPVFVNRAKEMADFLAWRWDAASGDTPLLVAVTGREGIGKTTFAVMASHGVAEHYPHAQLYYEVRGSDPQTRVRADQIAGYFLGQLGVARTEVPKRADERIGMLRSKLAGKPALILLDDVDDVEQVTPLLFESPMAAVVVTSRRRLDGLRRQGFQPLRLGGFEGNDAAELVGRIAGEEIGEIAPDVVRQLCVVCEGLPLALSIAAVRLSDPDESAEIYIEELLRGQPLTVLEVDGQRPVTRVFDAMYDDLDEQEARAYVLLSVIPSAHFGLGVAAATLDLDETDAARLLRRLIRKYVLDSFGDNRFRFHNLIHQHASDRAVAALSADDIEQAVTRAVQWYWRREVALDKSVSGRPVPPPALAHYQAILPAFTGEGAVNRAFAEFDLEWPNLVAAAQAARELPPNEVAGLFPLAMWFFGYTTARYPELLDAYQKALALPGDDTLRWQQYRDLAALHEGVGELDLADDYVARASSVHYPAGIASLHEWHGLNREGRGDLTGALEEFTKSWDAVPLMRADEQERARALLLMHSGRVLCKLNDLDQAHSALSEAYRYFAERPVERANQARAATWLGRTMVRRGGAPALLEQALAALRELGMTRDAVEVADELAELAEADGRTADAESYQRLAGELRDDSPSS